MKSLTLIGLVLLAVAAVLFYFIPNFAVIRLFEPTTLMGILAGVGIGLIIGGMVGYISKGSAIKAEQKKQAIKQLQKEKTELEKQAAELERLKKETSNTTNPQI